VAAIVVLIAKKASHSTWILYAGLIVLAVLFLPDAMLLEISSYLPSPLENPMTLTILLTLPLALIVTALLLYSGLVHFKKWQNTDIETSEVTQAQRKQAGRAFLVTLILSALILAKVLHNFYWFMVWDTTDDPLGSIWLSIPILVLFSLSALLFGLLPGKTKLAGFTFVLLIPVFILIAMRAQSVDYRKLTEARAEQVKQAIEAYYDRESDYPQTLQQLTPWYALSFQRPLIIYGQDWCYRGDADYYRLGYLDRDHWSSPILFGRLYSFKGNSPVKMDVCQPAIDVYRKEHPDWDKVLQDYGQPTPTPDFGE